MMTETLERKALETKAIHQGKPGYVVCANTGCNNTFPQGTGFQYERSPEYCDKECFDFSTED